MSIVERIEQRAEWDDRIWHDCPVCRGQAEVIWNPSGDPQRDEADPCPNPACIDGFVGNDRWLPLGETHRDGVSSPGPWPQTGGRPEPD